MKKFKNKIDIMTIISSIIKIAIVITIYAALIGPIKN